MTPTERIEQIEKELKELKEQVRHEADPVVLSGEFFGMAQKYIYPFLKKGVTDSESHKAFELAASFNSKPNKPNVGCAQSKRAGLFKIYKVSRHKSGKFSVEYTGKVFDPWAEQQAEFKPIGELAPDLKVGDEIDVRATVETVDSADYLQPIRLNQSGWVKSSTPARKVSP